MKQPLLAAVFLAMLVACKDARTPTGPTPLGPDVTGPELHLRPAGDTTVDSLGTLQIIVVARDRSNIKSLSLDIIGGGFAFPPLVPNDTVFGAVFPVALGRLRNTAFRFVARATDILDHETVTDTVTVTVL